MSVHLLKKKKLIPIHTNTLKIMYTVFDVSMYVDKNLQFKNLQPLIRMYNRYRKCNHLRHKTICGLF